MLPPIQGPSNPPVFPPPPAPPPASPTAPGFHTLKPPGGDNGFTIGIQGPDPQLAVGGSQAQQQAQRDATLTLEGPALLSYVTGHTPLTPREPPDATVTGILAGLKPNPPVGRDGVEVTHAVYQSHIPNASPEDAYRHFTQDAAQVFGAGGMEIRPAGSGLKDGGRYMLESNGPPPLWLPIQIKLDPSQNSITIQTLDGHPLRGEQTFTFTSDGQGGSVLTQDARFQASSSLVGAAQNISSVSAGQHEAWTYAHEEIYRQFNGEPDYQGLGTSPFSAGHLRDDLKTVVNAVTHPGDTAKGIIDTGGALTNAATDGAGRVIGWGLDQLGVPGSGVVKNVTDTAGDVLEGGADALGSAAKTAIDALNPFN